VGVECGDEIFSTTSWTIVYDFSMQRKRKPRRKRVVKAPSARTIFEQAELFFLAAKHLGKHSFAKAPQFFIPSAVCGAFALELYFKCLLVQSSELRAISPALALDTK
jgi:hypothetical protein